MRKDAWDACVVGAGLSGLACARALKASGLRVCVLEKSRGPGGRCATRTVAEGAVLPLGASQCHVSTAELLAFETYRAHSGLALERLAESHPDRQTFGWTNASNLGIGVAIREGLGVFAEGLQLRTQCRVVGLAPQSAGPWRLELAGSAPLEARAVVLALPQPQAAALLAPVRPELSGQLASSRWRCSYTLLLQLSESLSPSACRARLEGTPWHVAHLDASRAQAALHAESTALPEPERWDEASLPEIYTALRPRLEANLPLAVTHFERPLHRWRYAQPRQALSEAPYLLEASLLGLCGDGWGALGAGAALLSGHQLGEALAARL